MYHSQQKVVHLIGMADQMLNGHILSRGVQITQLANNLLRDQASFENFQSIHPRQVHKFPLVNVTPSG